MTLRSASPVAGTSDVIVIGAGHSGLAISRFLNRRNVEHMILERGEVANSWITERWDSLKLLTPNWQSRLPGYHYAGPNPDGFMSMQEVTKFVNDYAGFIKAPVVTKTTVTSVTPSHDGFDVMTNRGQWSARAVVLASGAFNVPVIPGVHEGVPGSVVQITPRDYRNPGQLPDGGVMIVGASATGLQLASEIQASGRPVTISAGEHVRMPRTYRGSDIQYWMHVSGALDMRIDEVDDINRARRVPSPQLVGSDNHRSLDLNSLTDEGAEIVGRLVGVRDGKAQFSGSLNNVCKLADLKMNRLLAGIDEWIDECGGGEIAQPAERFETTRVSASPRLDIDLNSGEIGSIIWATGFRPDYSWLDVPVLDQKGNLLHDGGIVGFPGLYVLGLPYLRRRKSSFIHGAGDDARDISKHLAGYLDSRAVDTALKVAV